ncbi:MAG: ribosome maturation factor RimM [Burkholderiales bacterium]|nr:ribosome maturation factor RimM [Burkholderiales bacterium]
MADNNVIPMGKIIGAFGVLGWVKIKSSSTNPESLGSYVDVLLFINSKWANYKIEKFFLKSDILHVKLADINTRDQAIALRGVTIGVLRSKFPTLAQDEYYWTDLIGLTVSNLSQQLLGTVDDLMETGANSVLVIKNEDQQYLVPFVGSYIINVDMEKRQIIVDWGLDY